MRFRSFYRNASVESRKVSVTSPFYLVASLDSLSMNFLLFLPLSGESGKAVVIKKEGLPPAEREKFEEGEKNNAFNEYASSMISVRRYLPDMRESQ